MKLFRKKSLHKKSKLVDKTPVDSNINNNILVSIAKKNIREMNFEKYIGHTVTIYVNAGGLVGNGFTGVLMGQSGMTIKLLVIPATPPSCSIGNACNSNINKSLLCLSCPYNENATVGSIAEIPFSSIAAFVHNNLGL